MLSAEDNFKLKGMRMRLVDELQKKGIVDVALLQALRKVPRHAFIESAFAEKAYQDIPLPIGQEQTISQPYTVAFMTQLLGVKRNNRMLEIGTGSGYQAAVLAEMGAEVFTVERIRELAQQAQARLQALGYQVRSRVADGTLGWPAHQPYQGIIVTAGSPSVPKALKEQLVLGGRLVIPVGEREAQLLLRITRHAQDEYEEESFGDFRFVPLIGERGWGA